MRYPEFLPTGGTVGFIAPSFGCATEPYRTAFDHAIARIHAMGYHTVEGPNCRVERGIGISNDPALCGAELNDAYCSADSDVLISCGGGELMCEVIPYMDVARIRSARPKWYMGYSDNTNFTFLSATLCDTAAIYGPCASSFGMEPWHESIRDAWDLLTGKMNTVHSYDRWERESLKDEEHPLAPYNLTEPTELKVFDKGIFYTADDKYASSLSMNQQEEADPFQQGNCDHSREEKDTANASTEYLISSANVINMQSTNNKKITREQDKIMPGSKSSLPHIHVKGRLLGGCIDCLVNLLGTRYDEVQAFNERYADDGILWFLEACDLNIMSIRRAIWQMKHAGWFMHVRGFLIGRPLCYGQEMFGIDQYRAVTDLLAEYNVPIIMDLDIGHLPPMMPLICGALAEADLTAGHFTLRHILS